MLNKQLILTGALTAVLFSSEAMASAFSFKQGEAKPVTLGNDFEQYELLDQVKEAVNSAISIHRMATSLSEKKETLQKHRNSIERYDEMKNRLEQNVRCNENSLTEHFSDGKRIWQNVSAWAEDSSSKLLAKASDSLGPDDGSDDQLKKLEAKSAAGDISDTGADIVTPDVSESTIVDMDVSRMTAYAKVRWDVGDKVLKDLYAYPEKWGKVKKRFAPWRDQRTSYNAYLKSKYERMMAPYNVKSAKLPPYPQLKDGDSGIPSDYYTGTVPQLKISESYSGATPDARWCGKDNECVRVNKGSLYQQHVAFVAALKAAPLKFGQSAPDMSAPYLPSIPLPPWREAAYITGVEPDLSTADLRPYLPEVWVRIIDNPVLFDKDGELGSLAEKKNGKIQFKADAYDAESGEVKEDKNGNPVIPLPLMTNRISAYLVLKDSLERQEPIKDRAKISIKEINENVIATFAKQGYNVENPDKFDLAKESDYQQAMKKIAELQKNKTDEAERQIKTLNGKFGVKLMSSVKKMLAEEVKTIKALQTDTDFLVKVNRDNAANIDTLIKTKIADDLATKTYKANGADAEEEANSIPPVGCPVL